MAKLEDDRKAAANIAADMLNDRWSTEAVEAQYARLTEVLGQISGGPAIRAAELAAKAARLAVGERHVELSKRLSEEVETELRASAHMPLEPESKKAKSSQSPLPTPKKRE